jgi:hypothetical protein
MQEIKVSGIPEEAELWRGGCGQWVALHPEHAALLRPLQEGNMSRIPLGAKVRIIAIGARSKYTDVAFNRFFTYKKVGVRQFLCCPL